MNYCVIGGKSYDVIVTAIEESFTILFSENTGRVLGEGAPMTLDPLGTFFSHTVTFKRSKENVKEFDRLYEYLSTPRYDGIPIEIVHGQTTIQYNAYISQGKRTLTRIDERVKRVLWGEFQVNFIPMRAQVTP